MSKELADSQVHFIHTSYGKTGVKVLYVARNTSRHEIYEYEVSSELELNTKDDYIAGDNRLIVPTDTQKNLVYVMAQKHGIKCPEAFALLLTEYFLFSYPQVVAAKVRVETVNGWQRIVLDGQEHSHAFQSNPNVMRYAEVYRRRFQAPDVSAGLRGLRVLKTTRSAFTDFHRCPYTTLQDAPDRILSTIVAADWKYSSTEQLDFCKAWSTVVASIIEQLVGPPDTGVFSPSVQLTLYQAEKLILGRVPQISEIHMTLPNVHYFDVDLTRFKDASLKNTKNVYLPVDKPSGNIKASLTRKALSKL